MMLKSVFVTFILFICGCRVGCKPSKSSEDSVCDDVLSRTSDIKRSCEVAANFGMMDDSMKTDVMMVMLLRAIPSIGIKQSILDHTYKFNGITVSVFDILACVQEVLVPMYANKRPPCLVGLIELESLSLISDKEDLLRLLATRTAEIITKRSPTKYIPSGNGSSTCTFVKKIVDEVVDSSSAVGKSAYIIDFVSGVCCTRGLDLLHDNNEVVPVFEFCAMSVAAAIEEFHSLGQKTK